MSELAYNVTWSGTDNRSLATAVMTANITTLLHRHDYEQVRQRL